MSGDQLELRVAWQRHLGDGPAADELFDSVLARHREPGRHYHDLRHVSWVVRHVIDLATRCSVDDLDAVVAAAFFHDAVYDFDRDTAAAGTNEAASARLAARSLTELGWSVERAERVAAMIVATEHHADDDPADADTAVLLAADLASLAAEPNAYADAVRNIRKEYGHLDDTSWRAGRSAVLESFLERDHIFPAQLGLDAWERRARANLTAELAALR